MLIAFNGFLEDGQTGFFLLTNMDASTEANEEKYVEVIAPIITAVNTFISVD